MKLNKREQGKGEIFSVGRRCGCHEEVPTNQNPVPSMIGVCEKKPPLRVWGVSVNRPPLVSDDAPLGDYPKPSIFGLSGVDSDNAPWGFNRGKTVRAVFNFLTHVNFRRTIPLWTGGRICLSVHIFKQKAI